MALAPFSVLASRLTSFFDSDRAKPTVLVLGYGWGARAFTESLDRRQFNVQVVSTRGERLNQPSMIHRLTATYSPPPSHLAIQVDEAVAIEPVSQQVQGRKATYPYDYLVIATGSEAFDFNIPGVKQYCQMCKTGEDMDAIRSLESKEAFVMGAGPTGIELACKLQTEGIRVQLVEAAPTILPGFSKAFQERVTEYLADQEIPVLKGDPIREITDKEIVLKTKSIPYSKEALLWTCGIRPVAFVRSLSGGGPLSVNNTLLYKKNIFALGDSIKGQGPPTAQNAVAQGTYLAHRFNQGHKGPVYQFVEKGRVLDLTQCMFVEVFDTVWYIPYCFTDMARWILK